MTSEVMEKRGRVVRASSDIVRATTTFAMKFSLPTHARRCSEIRRQGHQDS